MQYTRMALGGAAVAAFFTAMIVVKPWSSSAGVIAGPPVPGVLSDVELVFNGGPTDEVLVGAVSFSGFPYTDFITAGRVSDASFTGPAGAWRVVTGPDSKRNATQTVFEGDASAFEPALLEALGGRNLNHYIAVDDDAAEFAFVVTFDAEITDNARIHDPVPELLYFERGPSGVNSAIAVQPLDVNGNPIANAVVITPDNARQTMPTKAEVTLLAANGVVAGAQTMGVVAIDLSDLGVTSLHGLIVRTPRAGETTLDGASFTPGAGADTQPDFKILGVRTTGMSVPTWFMGH